MRQGGRRGNHTFSQHANSKTKKLTGIDLAIQLDRRTDVRLHLFPPCTLKEEKEVSDRQAALEMALKQIEKQFGKGSIMKLGEQTDRKISTVPSGSLALDSALGVGGYPRGRIIEIYGERFVN